MMSHHDHYSGINTMCSSIILCVQNDPSTQINFLTICQLGRRMGLEKIFVLFNNRLIFLNLPFPFHDSFDLVGLGGLF